MILLHVSVFSILFLYMHYYLYITSCLITSLAASLIFKARPIARYGTQTIVTALERSASRFGAQCKLNKF